MLHDFIVKEFECTKSLSALIYLIDRGRELEFSIHGAEYFISINPRSMFLSGTIKKSRVSTV